MAGSVVVDASVALKWVLDEPGSEAARELLNEEALRAPDFLLVEIANVLWSKVRRGILPRNEADAAYEAIAAAGFALTPIGELITPAKSLAYATDITMYDALYAALAARLGCPLVTADRSLADSVGAAALLTSVRLID